MSETCSVEGCEGKKATKGMCGKHYTRNRLHGSPHTVLRFLGDPEKAFWSKVEKSEGCWNWTGSKNLDGYGQFDRKVGSRYAHRISYEMAHGEIPAGLYVDHRCHNRSCVNPQHLALVTHKQNTENRAGAEVRSKSGIRGVYWSERLQNWCMEVKHKGVRHSANTFRTAARAERAAIEKRLELFTNNVNDRGLPEFAGVMRDWHAGAHGISWTDCPYEPCSVLDVDFRDAWS